MGAFLESVLNFDLSVFSAVFSIRTGFLDTVLNIITTIGDGWAFPLIAVILLLFKKTRKLGMVILGALGVMLVINNEILKPVIARIRPCYIFDLEALMSNKEAFVSGGKEEMFNEIYERVKAGIAAAPEMAAKWVQAYTFPGVDHMPTSWSFPSGHTSSSFAAATAVFSVNKKWGIPAYVFAAIVGFSRIYLGVHYCTDVLAGAVLGVVYGIIGVLVVSLIIKALKKNEKTAKFFE